MEPTSTQAVTPTSTPTPQPVKRLRRGDVREDGMVFWGYADSCKEGQRWMPKAVFEFNLDRRKKASHAHYLANKTQKAEQARAWRNNNRERLRKTQRDAYYRQIEKRREKARKWAQKNKAKISQRHKGYAKQRRLTDPVFALRYRLGNRVNSLFRRRGLQKSKTTQAMLGCTYGGFRHHLEARFLPGMGWHNKGKWHIDHIVPCAAARTKEELEALFHYTNLRPMWGRDNCSKNAKLPAEHELPAGTHPKVKEIYLTARMRSLEAGYDTP